MTVELKPCPICGEVLDICSEAMMGYSLHCKCGLTFGYFKKSEGLIDRWNRRAPEPRASDELFGRAIKASYEEGIEKGRESVKSESGTSVIRWARYDGTPETLPDFGEKVLLTKVSQRKFYPVTAEFEIFGGLKVWNDFTNRTDVHIGDLWALLPEPPEGME